MILRQGGVVCVRPRLKHRESDFSLILLLEELNHKKQNATVTIFQENETMNYLLKYLEGIQIFKHQM